jgi:hypothetical protein
VHTFSAGLGGLVLVDTRRNGIKLAKEISHDVCQDRENFAWHQRARDLGASLAQGLSIDKLLRHELHSACIKTQLDSSDLQEILILRLRDRSVIIQQRSRLR